MSDYGGRNPMLISERGVNQDCKVYIGDLGGNASKQEIETAFKKYGVIKNVWVARNPPGFAFVEYEDQRDARDSVKAMHGQRLCGHTVRVELSSGRTRQPPTRQRRDYEPRYRFDNSRYNQDRFDSRDRYDRDRYDRDRERYRRASPDYGTYRQSRSKSPAPRRSSRTRSRSLSPYRRKESPRRTSPKRDRSVSPRRVSPARYSPRRASSRSPARYSDNRRSSVSPR